MNEYIDFEDFNKLNNLYSFCIAFFNISEENSDYFIIKSEYRISKKTDYELNDEIYRENNKLLCNISSLPFELKKNIHYCYIEKTSSINSFYKFINYLYEKIQKFRQYYDNYQFSKVVYLSLFGLRGSPDFALNYYAVDIFRKFETENYIKKIFYLLPSLENAEQLNFNFRDLQHEYVNKIRERNNQIRINLRWFFDNYCNDLKDINIYKYNILISNKVKIKNTKHKSIFTNQFYSRMLIYIKTFFSKEYLTDRNIPELRKKIGFLVEPDSINKRNSAIVEIAKEIFPDICSGCYLLYDIKDRTFKYKNKDRYYLEIHHVISFANNDVDQIDNLTKLCPTCHKALSPNRANPEYQKQIIRSILEFNNAASIFIESFVENDNLDQKIEYVYSKLK